jgi:hypothetical protein
LRASLPPLGSGCEAVPRGRPLLFPRRVEKDLWPSRFRTVSPRGRSGGRGFNPPSRFAQSAARSLVRRRGGVVVWASQASLRQGVPPLKWKLWLGPTYYQFFTDTAPRAVWSRPTRFRDEVIEQRVRVSLGPDAHAARATERAVVHVDPLRAVPVHLHMIPLELDAQLVPHV